MDYVVLISVLLTLMTAMLTATVTVLIFIFKGMRGLGKSLADHKEEYRGFQSEVKTTIQFFRSHFKELDEAINHKIK